MIARLWTKLRRRRNLERDLAAELAFHRDMANAAGRPRALGHEATLREQAFDLWRFVRWENLWRDLRFAARSLLRSPTLVAAALASLGLGIGANTALFSLATQFLLSEPSIANGGRVVQIRLGGNSHVNPEVVDFVRNSKTFGDVGGEQAGGFANWNDGRETRRVFATFTTKNHFTMLGVPMAHGRGYADTDREQAVVLNHPFWRKHFAGDPAAVGRMMQLEGQAYTVLGVLPPDHRTLTGFGFSPDLYMPCRRVRGDHLMIFARLAPGQTREAALAAAKAVGARLDTVLPERYLKYAQNVTVAAVAGIDRLLREGELQSVAVFFALLMVLAGLVLLIACVNVASLLMARATARRREMAIRVSVGAGRWRLMQQSLTESLLLALGGTAVGLIVLRVLLSAAASVPLPVPIPIRLEAEPDWRAAIYAALLAAAATIACGLLPALQAVRESTHQAMQREPRQRLRRLLVATQIAVSLIVLTTGFLFLRNMLSAGQADPGFDIRHTIRADVSLPAREYESRDRRETFVTSALRELAAQPGIEAVAAARLIPFTDGSTRGGNMSIAGSPEKVRMRFFWNQVSPEYFRAMGIRVIAGATFQPSDSVTNPEAVIVNQTFARRYLANREPVGTVVSWEGDTETYRIVGVVTGTKNVTLGEDDEPQLYHPLQGAPEARVQFVVRTRSTAPATQLNAVRETLRRVDPAAAAEVQTLYSAIGLAFLPSRIGAVLMGGIGLLGLLLASVGLYGTLVYSVARRGQEIAVRMAIGASRADVSRMVFADSLRLIAWGSGVGLLAAYFLTRPLAMFLIPGVQPGDPVNYLAVAAIFGAVGLVAALGPARRAAATDPVNAVRQGF